MLKLGVRVIVHARPGEEPVGVAHKPFFRGECERLRCEVCQVIDDLKTYRQQLP